MHVLDFRCFLKEDGHVDLDLHGDWHILFPSAVKHQEGRISQTRRRGLEIDNGQKLSKCMESLPPQLAPHTLQFGGRLAGALNTSPEPHTASSCEGESHRCSSSLMT